jgi:hypothetical protein
VEIKTTAFATFPLSLADGRLCRPDLEEAPASKAARANLTWTSPSDANRISEKSHVFGTRILGTRSEVGRARDQLHRIIRFGSCR